MIASLQSATLAGLDALPVRIECEAGLGLPGFSLVGLPDGAVRESRDRVLSALRNSGFTVPNRRIVVNLAPGDLRKEGTGFDLPVALGVLLASDQCSAAAGGLDRVFLGELGLDGQVRAVRGCLSMAMGLRELGPVRLAVPLENLAEARLVPGLEVVGVADLREAAALLAGGTPVEHETAVPVTVPPSLPDFADVHGQESAKRALAVAAVGAHNVLMWGPPGSGKTLLARRLPGVLPPMTDAEALEATRIHSVAGLLEPGTGLLASRPFRSPHHSSSMASLVGGGSIPRPGEVSLAHHGILFLDEVAEFPRHVLEALRQPLEDGEVSISRAQQATRFPCRCLVVAAMNPCPCGNLGSRLRPCTCGEHEIERYRARLSGPLLDRFDLHLEIPSIAPEDLEVVPRQEMDSATLLEQTVRARECSRERQGKVLNSQLGGRALREACGLSGAARQFLIQASKRLSLSARAHERMLKVARSVADLEGAKTVSEDHLAEALAFRAVTPQVRTL